MKQEWKKEKLGKVYDVRDGTHDSPKYVKEGFALITSKNLKSNGLNFNNVNYITEQDYIDINKRSKVHRGDVLFAMIGTIGNPVVIIDEPDFAIKNVALFKVPKNQDSFFLKYYLDSNVVMDRMSKDAKGSTQKFVGLGYLRNFEIPLPPLPEQERIVAILDKAFTAIAKAKSNAEQNLKNTKELFESYLQNVFENKGMDWEEKTLGEVATFRNGMNFTKSSKGEKIKIVGVKDFQNSFWVPFETLETAILDGKLSDVDLLNEGDILVVRSNGNPQLIGRTLLAREVIGKVSHSGFTIRIRLNTFNIDPIYLCNFLKITKTRKILVDGGNGVGIKSLNQGSLSALIIPFPKSLTKQQTIVQKLDALSEKTKKLEAIYRQQLNDLEELKKSILQKAFAGELC